MKKTFGKMGQWTGEKLGTTKATQLDSSFIELETKTDEIDSLCKNLINLTEAYLQPDQAARAKLKLMGTSKTEKRYKQPEEEFGELMIACEKDINGTAYGRALQITGESEKRVGEARHAMDAVVMQAVVKPLTDFHNREVKEVQKCRQKLDSRRLQYDSALRAYEKKDKKSKDANKEDSKKFEDEFKSEEKKFEDIKEVTYDSMLRLIENDAEQCGQLLAFVEAQYAFHTAAAEILKPTLIDLDTCIKDAGPLSAKRLEKYSFLKSGDQANTTSSSNENLEQKGEVYAEYQNAGYPAPTIHCTALYDHVPAEEGAGELAFSEGDKIVFLREIDTEFLEGELNGITGTFPTNYVTFE